MLLSMITIKILVEILNIYNYSADGDKDELDLEIKMYVVTRPQLTCGRHILISLQNAWS